MERALGEEPDAGGLAGLKPQRFGLWCWVPLTFELNLE